MSTVTSADGTTIAFTRAGQGPALILVDGALCSRSFGPMPKLAAQLTPHFTVFMRFVGTPAIFTAVMPLTPVWPKLKAVAPTLPYDIEIMQDHQRGTPLESAEWAAVKVPALVAAGGKSPAWMANATRALADALPDARYRTLPGQNHMVKPQAIAPVLTEFFATTARNDS
jgi:pimeloyl-ACP methyl ester carboxylesterase